MKQVLACWFAVLVWWSGLAQAQGGKPDPSTVTPLTRQGDGQVYVIEAGTDFFSYVFKVNQPLLVNAVGVAIASANSSTVTLKLFDAAGTNLIDQSVKPYSDEVTPVGGYGFTSIHPLTLPTGIYILAVGPVFTSPNAATYVNYVEYNGQDQGAYISPFITLLGGIVSPTSQFTSAIARDVVNSAVANYGKPDYLSGTFLTGTLSAVPVPESGAYAMFMVGLAVLGVVCRRRRALVRPLS